MRLVPRAFRQLQRWGARSKRRRPCAASNSAESLWAPSSRSHGCGKEALHEHAIVAITNDDERASASSVNGGAASSQLKRSDAATRIRFNCVAPQRGAPTPGQPTPSLASEVVPRSSGARVPQFRRLLSHREDSQAKSHQRLVTLPRSIDITTTRQGSLTLHCPRTIDATRLDRLGDWRRGAQDTIAFSDRVGGNEGSRSHPHPAVGADEPREPEH